MVLSLVLVGTAGAEDDISISYQEPLKQLRLAYSRSSDDQKIGADTVRSLRFDAFGKHFDINLEVNRTLLDAKQRELLDARYEIYRGEILGMANSWARLVIADGVPRGMLWDGTEMWAIEVATNEATGAEEAFMFRLDDVQIVPGSLACSELSAATNGGEFAKAVLSGVTASAAQGPGATSQIDLAVIGDFEFTSDKGAGANAALTTRMNNVDGIFSMQLGVQLNVNRIDTFAANDDPFTDQLDSGTLLDELTDYRADTPAQNSNGLSHLFTGRNLDGSTVGIAFSSALCSRRFGAGLTQGTHSETIDSLIAAHELGHNFGAPHDGTSGSACEAESQDFLMAPSLNGSDEFSPCSITQMQDDVNSASCITPLLVSDAAVLSGGQPADALLGDVAAIT
ncbi:MAG: M12 family metallo-peptidase, partial [Gammaproteobacteria bacterium]|nr:M12 family metallo-peptidase [Gammaproteobacteria bacterium]